MSILWILLGQLAVKEPKFNSEGRRWIASTDLPNLFSVHSFSSLLKKRIVPPVGLSACCTVSRCSLHASCLQFGVEEAIHITGALEIETSLGVAELQEEA